MNREGSEAVAAYLAKNKTLLTLSLSNNPIRDMGAKTLATVSGSTRCCVMGCMYTHTVITGVPTLAVQHLRRLI